MCSFFDPRSEKKMTLAHLDAALRELRLRTDQEQQALQGKVDDESAALHALRVLCARLSENSTVFDQEDRATIEGCIAQRESRVAELQLELHRNREDTVRREAIFERIGQTIRLRQSVLDAVEAESGVLSRHAELLTFFAKKQLTLEELLSQEMHLFAASVAPASPRPPPLVAQPHPAAT